MASIINSSIIIALTIVLSYLLFDLMVDDQDAPTKRSDLDMCQYPKGFLGEQVKQQKDEIRLNKMAAQD